MDDNFDYTGILSGGGASVALFILYTVCKKLKHSHCRAKKCFGCEDVDISNEEEQVENITIRIQENLEKIIADVLEKKEQLSTDSHPL